MLQLDYGELKNFNPVEFSLRASMTNVYFICSCDKRYYPCQFVNPRKKKKCAKILILDLQSFYLGQEGKASLNLKDKNQKDFTVFFHEIF